MKVALLGATGFVGSALLKEALDRGHVVTAIVRHPEKLEKREGLTAKAGDVYDTASLATLIRGNEAIISAFNPGWKNPNLYDDQVRGTASIIAAIKKAGINSGGCVDPIFPHFQRGTDRLGNQRVTRLEVLIEAAHSKAGFLHQIRDSDPSEPFFAEFLRGYGHDALVRIRLFSLGMTHGPLNKVCDQTVVACVQPGKWIIDVIHSETQIDATQNQEKEAIHRRRAWASSSCRWKTWSIRNVRVGNTTRARVSYAL
jgi:hypothetical protein